MELGKIQKLKIVRKVDFGVYLGTEAEQVLLPKKQVPSGAQVGDCVQVFVYRDSSDRLISTTKFPKATLGKLALLEVKDRSKAGTFLDWGLEKDLFMPFKETVGEVKIGDHVLVAIYIDKSDRLCATMKVYNYLETDSEYKPDDMVEGVVYNYNPDYGAFVAVDNKYHGLIQKKELVRDVKIGQKVQVRVTGVRPDGKLDLSYRKKAYLQIDEDADRIYQIIKQKGGKLDYTDKASPEIIKKDFQMSKNEFKRAIGRMLKEGRVTIGENNIFLHK